MGSGKGLCIIPVFLSYMGCPRRCLFCSQKGITENDSERTFDELDQRVETYVTSRTAHSGTFGPTPGKIEIAFYGSTFTSISEASQEAYLRWALGWVETGYVQSIRVSTRPDELSEEKISRLARYGVKTIEIGVQSFDENTLRQNRRYYTNAEIAHAFALLRTEPFQLGIHLMTHMYGSSRGLDEQSLAAALSYRPDFLRVHPTLVIRQTGLEDLYLRGLYRPASLFETVDQCSDWLLMCQQAGTPVVRMGLHIPVDRVTEVLAGPYHPSFGDLVYKMASLKQRLAAERHHESEKEEMEKEHREALGSYKGFFTDWYSEQHRLILNSKAQR